MLNIQEVGLTASREIRRNLRSAKGIAMFVLFFLGGLMFSVLVSTVIRLNLQRAAQKANMTEIPEELRSKVFAEYLSLAYDGNAGVAEHLAKAPAVLYFLFKGTLIFLPFLVLLVGFDQVAGEVQHRTIRYIAGRASRGSIVLGKALGVWAIISVMVLVLHLTVWIFMLVQGGQNAGMLLSWGARFWLFSSLAAASYVGYTAIMSALFRTPIVALMIGAGTGLALGLMHLILDNIESAKAVAWAFPNHYDILIVSPQIGSIVGGAGAYLAWGAACTAAAVAVVQRRDI